MGALAFGEASCRAPGALNLRGVVGELEGKPWKTPGQTHTQPTSFHSNQRKGIEVGVLGNPPKTSAIPGRCLGCAVYNPPTPPEHTLKLTPRCDTCGGASLSCVAAAAAELCVCVCGCVCVCV